MSDLSILQGDDRQFVVTVTTPAGVAVNLTGTIALTFRVKADESDADADALLTRSLGSGVTITNATGGLAAVQITGTETAALPLGSLHYDLRHTDAASRITTVAAGAFWVNQRGATLLSIAECRALLPNALTDDALQGVIDREKAYLESVVGPLTGTRTETFYLYRGMAREPVVLRRPASTVTVTDNAVAVDDAEVRLLADGRTVRRLAVDGDWGGLWTGPVVATYSPNDELLVARVLIDMIRLASTTGPYASETMGSYSYTRGSGASAAPTRRGLAESLLRRPTATSIRISDPPVWPWGWRT